MPIAESKPEIKTIGHHKLVLGDCLEYIPKMPWHSIDLLLTDPPYGLDYKSNFWIQDPSKRKIQRHFLKTDGFKKIANDGEQDALETIEKMFTLVSGKLKGDAGIYCFCSPKNIEEVLRIIKAQYHVKNILVWDKDNWGGGDLEGAYGNQYENIIYASRTKARKLNYRIGDILQYPRVSDPQLRHPNQKPDSLLTKLVLNSSSEQNCIFDPFMGSGRTGVCSARNNRTFIGCERDSGYFTESFRAISETIGAIKNLPLGQLGEVISD